MKDKNIATRKIKNMMISILIILSMVSGGEDNSCAQGVRNGVSVYIEMAQYAEVT